MRNAYKQLRRGLIRDRLQYYPPLQRFPPEEAWKRLEAYEREEREKCAPWLTLIDSALVAWIALWLGPVLFGYRIGGLYLVAWIPLWVVQYVLDRRIRPRVTAKVEAELCDGRVWSCLECGYDLRGSHQEVRPECGQPYKVS